MLWERDLVRWVSGRPAGKRGLAGISVEVGLPHFTRHWLVCHAEIAASIRQPADAAEARAILANQP